MDFTIIVHFGQLVCILQYARRTVRFPVNNPATIKLTQYPLVTD